MLCARSSSGVGAPQERAGTDVETVREIVMLHVQEPRPAAGYFCPGTTVSPRRSR
jgi:hypothetical protein